MKSDGHTHTEYCFHGSREATEEFVIRAIELGFDSYSFTEHPPLPGEFKKLLPYSNQTVDAIAMKEKDLDQYIKEMHHLKNKYKDKILLKVGLEVDFLPEHISWTRNLLNDYGPYLDDSLLSLHFLRGVDGYRCVDLNPEDFKEGLIDFYGSYDDVVFEYFRVMDEQIKVDLGPFKPKRIGHFTLYQIFQRKFFETSYSHSNIALQKFNQLFQLIKDGNYSLDFNMAGFHKPHCLESYPAESIANLCLSLGIDMIYGSDSHSVKDVGRGYGFFEKMTAAK
ncbi:histidinol-phosphatase HisJ [Neobacillus sp. PS3-34]|uniref:histidinol-phosphatase HisJ n=1 Tax=Neobacillus sp. PS3-34 TaxID=3070678 RepID=UPI0027E1527F|nr:histidinol-phosphatase HisJ [Neobacillus sp. PS3-34]WML48342.1 histidinol-phosphatase HisJ [Neobacillus sp. PS3-34]